MNGSSGIQSANGGAMAFTTTHWSLVLEAQGDTPAAQRALEILCRTSIGFDNGTDRCFERRLLIP